MRAAYADPPYLGLAQKFYAKHHPDAGWYDSVAAHRHLIERLSSEFDCWALSLHAPSLRTMLNLCPDDVRVMPWVKPFASWKPGPRVQYVWEPVIVRGGRPVRESVRDYCDAPMAMGTGLRGAKPRQFAFWIFEVLGLGPDDNFVDVFPGSGTVGAAWREWCDAQRPVEQFGLEMAT